VDRGDLGAIHSDVRTFSTSLPYIVNGNLRVIDSTSIGFVRSVAEMLRPEHPRRRSHEADGRRIDNPKIAVDDIRKRRREGTHVGMNGAQIASIHLKAKLSLLVGEDRLIATMPQAQYRRPR